MALPVPVPTQNPETARFWEAIADDVLLLKRCTECGAVIWYPRQLCTSCSSMATEWFEASGRGLIYSYTINHRPEGLYREAGRLVLAYVELEEGPRVLTHLVDAEDHELAVGLAVEVVFDHGEEGPGIYRFRLSA